MRIEYLREFIAAATYMNFTKAAEKLYISQPKLSMHIASLEDELGFRLFEREGGLKLTHEGRHFFEGVTQIVEDLDRLTRQCKEESSSPAYRFTLGEFPMFEMFPPGAISRFTQAVELLHERHPSFEMDVQPIENTMSIVDMVLNGIADVSFRTCCMDEARNEIIDLGDGSSVLPLEMDDMVAWMRQGHPLASYSTLTAEQVARYPITLGSCRSMDTFTSTRQDFMKIHGLEGNFRTRNVPSPSFYPVVLKNDDISLISTYFSRSQRIRSCSEMVAIPLTGTKAQSCFCLCFATGTTNPAVLELIDIMRGQIAK